MIALLLTHLALFACIYLAFASERWRAPATNPNTLLELEDAQRGGL